MTQGTLKQTVLYLDKYKTYINELLPIYDVFDQSFYKRFFTIRIILEKHVFQLLFRMVSD